MVELHLPEGVNYECTSCGKCCSGWAVPMTEADYDRISAEDWSDVNESYEQKQLFRELKKHEKANTPYTHKIVSETGICPFLKDNLCFIHSKGGSEFKPSICQLFPYSFTQTPSGVYATVSFVSVGAIYNSGTPLVEQRELLDRKFQDFQKLFPDYQPDWSQVKLAVGQPLTWDQYLGHEKELLKLLNDFSLPMEERLKNCSNYLVSQCSNPPAAISAGTQPLKPLDKDLLVLFHKMYFPVKPLKQGQGDFDVMRLVLQSMFGSKKLQMPGSAFDIEELNQIAWPDDDEEINNLIYRYIYSCVFGKKYFGAGFGQVSVISGFHHLILMYALIKLQSKATAKMRSAHLVKVIDVAVTVRQLERQVGETKLGGYSAAGWEMMLFPPTRAYRYLANC